MPSITISATEPTFSVTVGGGGTPGNGGAGNNGNNGNSGNGGYGSGAGSGSIAVRSGDSDAINFG